MTLLAETRRLVLPPSSNLPQSDDFSWLFLVPVAERAVCCGDPGSDRLEAMSRFFSQISTTADPVGRGNGDPVVDTVVVAAGASAETLDSIGHRTTEATIVQLPGSDRISRRRFWITSSSKRRRSKFIGRARKLLRLVLARAAVALGRPSPATARSHASDVDFTTIPEGLASTSDSSRVSVGLTSKDLPSYLQRIAKEAGHQRVGAEWAFGPPRGFASQKVVFLIDKVEGVFQTVVKLTQHERFNHRLTTEGTALKRLADRGGDGSLIAPTYLFDSTYKGRVVLAQTALQGVAMRAVAMADPASPIPSSAFDALIELGGIGTSQTQPGERSYAFTELADTFNAVYRPPAAVRERIRESVQRLGETEIPSVMMHGDPGMWNFLVTEDGQPGLLDWENADFQGVPLWDLFIFARTFGVFIADAHGTRYTHHTFAQQLLEESALKEVLFHQIREYRRRVEFSAGIVDDLFVMCWTQQAVRQAAVLANPAWGESTGTRFLREALRRPLGFHD